MLGALVLPRTVSLLRRLWTIPSRSSRAASRTVACAAASHPAGGGRTGREGELGERGLGDTGGQQEKKEKEKARGSPGTILAIWDGSQQVRSALTLGGTE